MIYSNKKKTTRVPDCIRHYLVNMKQLGHYKDKQAAQCWGRKRKQEYCEVILSFQIPDTCFTKYGG